MRVLILGAGPAGLFAAHAAVRYGHEVMIFSKDARQSFMKGAQYLHRPIPDLNTSEPFRIRYQLEGSVDGYRRKVYGTTDMRGKQVSVETLVGEHDAWDIREAYDAAWALYGSKVRDLDLRPASDDISRLIGWAGPDLTVSTIPATILCSDPNHVFRAEQVWSTDKSPALPADEDNLVVCSGEKDHAWYRASRIHGWENTEYPSDRRPPITPIWEVIKPISTTCDCLPDVLRLGRYGLWEKGVLADGAYYSMEENLRSGYFNNFGNERLF